MISYFMFIVIVYMAMCIFFLNRKIKQLESEYDDLNEELTELEQDYELKNKKIEELKKGMKKYRNKYYALLLYLNKIR